MRQVIVRLVAALLGFVIGAAPVGLWRFHSFLSNLERGADLQALVSEPANTELRRRVAEARQRGESRLSILSPMNCDRVSVNLRDALAHYSVLLVRPVERRTYEAESGLRSWYRLQVVETLSVRPRVRSAWDSDGDGPPADMLPIGEDELLIPVRGGTMFINGVIVSHQASSDLNFAPGQTYLLFLNLDAESRVAHTPWLDIVGIFAVNEDGTFQPTTSRYYELQEQLRRRFGNSVDRLRQHFRR